MSILKLGGLCMSILKLGGLLRAYLRVTYDLPMPNLRAIKYPNPNTHS
jgi:hypothetical protein